MASLKITRSGSTAMMVPEESSVTPWGEFIQALAATTETLPHTPARTIGTPVQKCVHGLQPPPAEDVDRDEDGLGEEEQPLERERDTEGLAPLAHELRPQEAELEGQDRPGHRPHGERHGHVLRPALGQSKGIGIIVPDPPVVGDEGHRRPGHPQRHQDDVEGEREGHLRPRPEDRVHVGQHGNKLVQGRYHGAASASEEMSSRWYFASSCSSLSCLGKANHTSTAPASTASSPAV